VQQKRGKIFGKNSSVHDLARHDKLRTIFIPSTTSRHYRTVLDTRLLVKLEGVVVQSLTLKQLESHFNYGSVWWQQQRGTLEFVLLLLTAVDSSTTASTTTRLERAATTHAASIAGTTRCHVHALHV
jgi:hypothetical protein